MRNLHPAIKRVIDAQCISLTQAATLIWDEEFGVHVRGNEEGQFTLRHLFSVRICERDEENCARDDHQGSTRG